jgi:hypothetical protein
LTLSDPNGKRLTLIHVHICIYCDTVFIRESFESTALSHYQTADVFVRKIRPDLQENMSPKIATGVTAAHGQLL